MPSTARKLDPVKVAKGPETLAGILRESILSGTIAAGASFAPERTLVEQTGLSRATVREALRILETEGLVVSRSGRNGGAQVQAISDAGVARAVNVFVRGLKVDSATLRETREIIETATVRLACERRTDADLAEIDAISARLEAAVDDLPAIIEENARWHVAVAEAGHNPLLVAFMKAIAPDIPQPGDQGEVRLSRRGRLDLFRVHRRIVEAIRARDPDAAERRMLRHLYAYRANDSLDDPGEGKPSS